MHLIQARVLGTQFGAFLLLAFEAALQLFVFREERGCCLMPMKRVVCDLCGVFFNNLLI